MDLTVLNAIRASVDAGQEVFNERLRRVTTKESERAAFDIWIAGSAHRDAPARVRANLWKTVTAAEAFGPEVQSFRLTQLALLRAAGLDDVAAARACIAAGATQVDLAAVLGVAPQAVQKRLAKHLGPQRQGRPGTKNRPRE
ncbi:hypothetical protein [Mycobacteroides abscessus]|uniref:hypothetical protein n=1 Tax=Mycobacteroides abscessus TaxID=36809 RepID=UPI0012FFD3C7|nr:hypothetical protein [Mycobacteroides abscessus]